ncbi:MAG: tyrosine-type recombinase/integrase [Nitrososphaeria archaeon]|nr:tyrosine-type recombinase/integrase [Nitrososphaeria archaeon]NIQ32301.1 tyrosine-type recombinase/integrase [Nitrososphaeria archaeon]
MRAWEDYLRVGGWRSGYSSVDRILRHYSRKVASEHTRRNVCETLKGFCEFVERDPDKVVALTSREASQLVQGFVDSLADKSYSVRYVNVSLAYLTTFFKVNGFKGERALDVERYHQPARYRKVPEYVPAAEEIYRMVYAARSRRNKALILGLYTSGLRNSTLRALLYRDVEEELNQGLDVVKVPVYPEMKEVDPDACKGNIPYYSFFSREAVNALHEYIEERKGVYGGIEGDEPLFASDSNNLSLEEQRRTRIKKRTLAAIVKRAARKADIKDWKNVYPHCIRKAFESALRNNRLDPKDQEFLMGHILSGSQDTYYDHTKIESLREKYAEIRFFPERLSEEVIDEKVEEAIKKLVSGEAEFTIPGPDGKPMRVKVVTTKVEEENPGQANGGDSIHKFIGENELLQHLDEGWEIVKELSTGMIVIRKNLKFSKTELVNFALD